MKRALEQDRRWKTDIGRQTPDDRPEKMEGRGKQDVDVAAETEPPGAAEALRPGESDDAIIERIMNGEMNAFEVLARRYERWVCGIVARRVARDQVEEVAHQVFIHAYRSLPHFYVNPSADGFRQWLTTIAVRCCCDYQRAVHRHPTCAISNLSAEDFQQMERTTQAAACEAFHAETEQDTAWEVLREAMDRLDADDQILLGLIYGTGYSLPETADILGDRLETVKSRACRVRALLRRRLDSVEPNRQVRPQPSGYNPTRTDGSAVTPRPTDCINVER